MERSLENSGVCHTVQQAWTMTMQPQQQLSTSYLALNPAQFKAAYVGKVQNVNQKWMHPPANARVRASPTTPLLLPHVPQTVYSQHFSPCSYTPSCTCRVKKRCSCQSSCEPACAQAASIGRGHLQPVSYTHLTLPTILLV